MSAHFKIYLWKRAPFLRLLIPLIAGILLQNYFPLGRPVIFGFWLMAVLFFALFNVFSAWFRYRNAYLRGIVIHLIFISSGAAVMHLDNVQNDSRWFGHSLRPANFLKVTIKKPPEEKAKSVKILAEVTQIISHGKTISTRGSAVLYLKKDLTSLKLQYGNQIVIRNTLKRIKNTGNPGAFDYASYMERRQILYSAYLAAGDYFISAGTHSNWLKKEIFDIQNYVLRQIDRYVGGTRENALVKALLIGYRLHLDQDLLQAYSNAGVVHLVAISGLHLGIIYGLLLFVTMKIPFLKKQSFLRVALVLFCIWLFAVITGASPSVLRAATMFSFISLGSLFRTNTFTYNSLAASAFILLIFDPFILWNAGFQLSYLAVIGIVTLQKRLYSLFYLSNKIIDFFWQIASVSIAAQAFTLPVVLYYFHQFPLLFLFANLILIPLATVVLWGSVFLILISFLPVVAALAGSLINELAGLMNQIVLRISGLSFSVWDMIYIQLHDVFLLFFIMAAFFLWLYYKNSIALMLTLVFTLLLSISFYADGLQKLRQKKLIVYNYPKATAVDFFQGKNFFMKADDRVHQDVGAFRFHVLPSRILHAARHSTQPEILHRRDNMFLFGNKTILILDSVHRQMPLERVYFDYVILSQNVPVSMSEIYRKLEAGCFIFDSSNSLYKIDRWKKDCEELHLQFHSVPEDGAFITDI